MMKRSKRPPLGVRPRYLLDEERITELKGAISRYIKSNWPIPDNIINEYNELTERLDVEGDNNLRQLAEVMAEKW